MAAFPASEKIMTMFRTNHPLHNLLGYYDPLRVGVLGTPEEKLHIKNLKPPPDAFRHARQGKPIADEKKPDDFVPPTSPDADGGSATAKGKGAKAGPVLGAMKKAAKTTIAFLQEDGIWVAVPKPPQTGQAHAFDCEKKSEVPWEFLFWG